MRRLETSLPCSLKRLIDGHEDWTSEWSTCQDLQLAAIRQRTLIDIGTNVVWYNTEVLKLYFNTIISYIEILKLILHDKLSAGDMSLTYVLEL